MPPDQKKNEKRPNSRRQVSSVEVSVDYWTRESISRHTFSSRLSSVILSILSRVSLFTRHFSNKHDTTHFSKIVNGVCGPLPRRHQAGRSGGRTRGGGQRHVLRSLPTAPPPPLRLPSPRVLSRPRRFLPPISLSSRLLLFLFLFSLLTNQSRPPSPPPL